MWFLDNGCSRHVMGDVLIFIEFNHRECDYVTYGDNNPSTILGESIVENPSTITIKGILLVKGFKQNLEELVRTMISELSFPKYFGWTRLISHVMS